MTTTAAATDWGTRNERWEGVRSHHVDVDGVDVHGLWHEGRGDGTPTLLVHGLGGASLNWLEVVGALASDGPVFAPDLPGFGRTEPAERADARMARQRRFLTRLLDALGWDAVHVHGNSMGGLLSVLLAASEPDRVVSLVLAAPALPSPRDLRAVSASAALRLAPFVSSALGAQLLTRLYSRHEPEVAYRRTAELVVSDLDRVDPVLREVHVENVAYARERPWRVQGFAVAASDLIRQLVRRNQVDAAVDAVVAPTLLVWGGEDLLVSRQVVDRALRRRPDFSRAELGGVGHAPMMEAPDRYLEAVDAWRRFG